MTFTYPAVFKKQPDGSYTATFPDLSGIEVRGRDLDDAIRNARDAMFDWLTVEFDEEDPRLPTISELRDLKLKCKPTVEGDKLRVSSASRDVLQQVIAFLKDKDYGQPLQYVNYR